MKLQLSKKRDFNALKSEKIYWKIKLRKEVKRNGETKGLRAIKKEKKRTKRNKQV